MHVALIMAHPDDADIYCGGSVAAWRLMGAEVTILIATDGSKGGNFNPEDLAKLRSEEARIAKVRPNLWWGVGGGRWGLAGLGV